MSRLSRLNRQNLNIFGRFALILVLVTLADGLVAEFASKPFPWVAIIPGFVPVLIGIFVIPATIRADKSASPNAE